MLTRMRLAVGAGLLLASSSCNTDASLSKDVVGTWAWHPRAVLPADKVVEKGFPTPDLEAFALGADGRCVVIVTIPSYDTDVGGKPFRVPNYWLEYEGTWTVSKGELAIDASPRWGAGQEPSGWRPEANANAGGFHRTFRITDHKPNLLGLRTLAIGDYDRELRRASLPPRPALRGGEPAKASAP